jgi:biopolymer transport protein ExbD
MKLKKIDRLNVIPFIDIMLVLLVIVLSTATFASHKNIEVDLPNGKQSITQKELEKELIITINKEGHYFLNKQKVNLLKLEAYLSTIPDTTPIQLMSDKESKFNYFVQIMQILKENNFNSLYIVTQTNNK